MSKLKLGENRSHRNSRGGLRERSRDPRRGGGAFPESDRGLACPLVFSLSMLSTWGLTINPSFLETIRGTSVFSNSKS